MRHREPEKMALELQPTAPSDLDAIAAALVAGFKAAPDAPFVNRRLLQWKYFEPGPEWEGSRSYVLKRGDTIQAHCGVWPINMGFGDRRVTCLCFVDWVSDKSLPGAGFLLKKKLMTFAETAIVVGGTSDTRAVIPKLGFKTVGEVGTFARVVRPWKQFRTRPTEGIGKDAARLVRNTAWSRAAEGTVPKDWAVTRVQSFDSIPDQLQQTEHPAPERSAGYLNYWLRCPAAKVSGCSVSQGGQARGYFLLLRVGGQARVADIRLTSGRQEDWNAAYTLAARTAAEDPETCEILGVASTEFARRALLSSGFRQRGGLPLFLYDPQRKLSDAPALFWNLIDGDAAYLHDPAYPYST